jgi:hypothetical protein
MTIHLHFFVVPMLDAAEAQQELNAFPKSRKPAGALRCSLHGDLP